MSEYGHSHAKSMISANTTCCIVEIEQTCISRIVVTTTTKEERIASVHEVSVIV